MYDIPEDTEVQISYIDIAPGVEERRHCLLDKYFFLCRCDRCVFQEHYPEEGDPYYDEKYYDGYQEYLFGEDGTSGTLTPPNTDGTAKPKGGAIKNGSSIAMLCPAKMAMKPKLQKARLLDALSDKKKVEGESKEHRKKVKKNDIRPTREEEPVDTKGGGLELKGVGVLQFEDVDEEE